MPPRRAFGRGLTLVAEHTWGVDIKSYLRDEHGLGPARPSRPRARSDPRFAYTEASWAEQRAYLDAAVAALAPADRERAAEALADTAAPPPARPRRTATELAWRLADRGSRPTPATFAPSPRPPGAACRAGPAPDRLPPRELRRRRRGAAHATPTSRTARNGRSSTTTSPASPAPRPPAPPPSRRPCAARSEPTPCRRRHARGGAAGALGAPPSVEPAFEPLADGLLLTLRLRGKAANRMPEAGFLSVCPKARPAGAS